MNINKIKYPVKSITESKNTLVIGQRKSGKTMTALKFAVENIENDKAIIFTSSKKQDVETIITSMIGYKDSRLNLRSKIYECQPELISLSDINDKRLLNIFLGIVKPIQEFKPEKIVFDEITPFLNFSDLELLKMVFEKVFNYLHVYQVKSMFTIGQPVSPRARLITEILKRQFSELHNLS